LAIVGSFTGYPEGTIFTFAGGSASITYQAAVNTARITLLTPTNVSPQVGTIKVNDGSIQRSRILSLTVPFTQRVNLPTNPTDAFQLRRQSDNALVGLAAAVDDSGPTTIVTLTFTGGPLQSGSLADGRYTLTAFSSQISTSYSSLDGNSDGTAGDDFTLAGTPANGLFRLFGDADGNGTVNSADFLNFRLAFLTTSVAFDADGSGTVDADDFLAFRLNFLKSV
jgi:hypothetical protein